MSARRDLMASAERMNLLSELRSELGYLTTLIERIYVKLEGKGQVDQETQALIQSDAIDRIARVHRKVQDFVTDRGHSTADPGFMGTTIDGHLNIVTRRLESLKAGDCLQDRTWPNSLLSALRDYQMSLEIIMRKI